MVCRGFWKDRIGEGRKGKRRGRSGINDGVVGCGDRLCCCAVLVLVCKGEDEDQEAAEQWDPERKHWVAFHRRNSWLHCLWLFLHSRQLHGQTQSSVSPLFFYLNNNAYPLVLFLSYICLLLSACSVSCAVLFWAHLTVFPEFTLMSCCRLFLILKSFLSLH